MKNREKPEETENQQLRIQVPQAKKSKLCRLYKIQM